MHRTPVLYENIQTGKWDGTVQLRMWGQGQKRIKTTGGAPITLVLLNQLPLESSITCWIPAGI